MRSFRTRLGLTLLLACPFGFAQVGFAQDNSTPVTTSAIAAAYLNHALDLMQQYALHRSEIDWASVRRGAVQEAQGAQTTDDAYRGIYFALAQLREHHSSLRIPDSLTEQQKQRAYASRRATLRPPSPDEKAPPASPFRTRTEPEGHFLHIGDQTFAWVSIPACGAKHSDLASNLADYYDYATKLHTVAAELEAAHPYGWIIDLRGNGGGNMWPMLAGIGFVLGTGNVGSFVDGTGAELAWSYRDGVASVEGRNMNDFTLDTPRSLPMLPSVAVLIDSGTASSGEAVAVAFEGRPRTRFFGSHTKGLATSNETLPLPDGATLFLNSAVDADRNHRRYEGGIEPDMAFPVPATQPPENEDAVLLGALSWLSTTR